MAAKGREGSQARRTPAQERAILHLRRVVERHTRDRRTQLPSITELATQAGVCYVTMWRASELLKREGIVQSARSKRLSLPVGPDAEAVDASPKPHGYKWQRVVRGIEGAIQTGGHTLGEDLPDRVRTSRRISRRAR